MQLSSATCSLRRAFLCHPMNYRSAFISNQHRQFSASSFIFNLSKEDETLYQVLSVKTNID